MSNAARVNSVDAVDEKTTKTKRVGFSVTMPPEDLALLDALDTPGVPGSAAITPRAKKVLDLVRRAAKGELPALPAADTNPAAPTPPATSPPAAPPPTQVVRHEYVHIGADGAPDSDPDEQPDLAVPTDSDPLAVVEAYIRRWARLAASGNKHPPVADFDKAVRLRAFLRGEGEKSKGKPEPLALDELQARHRAAQGLENDLDDELAGVATHGEPEPEDVPEPASAPAQAQETAETARKRPSKGWRDAERAAIHAVAHGWIGD